MISVTRSVGALLVAAVMSVLASCGTDREEKPSAPPKDAEAVRGGTAILAEVADMGKPLPLLIETTVDANLQDIMYMSPLQGAWRDGKLVYLTSNDSPMAMAWHYEFLPPDSTALRYRLRSALRWSDGQPITAHDVVWTYQALGNTRLAAPRQDFVEHIDSVVAENDSTVTFHFDRRYPEMIFHSTHAVVPKHVYENASLANLRSHPTLTDPGNGKLVVSGAYMIGQWNKGERVVLVPNPYFEPKPLLEQIVIRVIPETTTRLVELQTGNVDYVAQLPFDQVEKLKAQQPGLRFEREENRSYEYIAYNPKTFAPFADAEIRRALGLAVDVSGIISALQMGDFARPAGGPYPPIFKELHDPERMKPLGYDTAEAKRVLESKGWTDGNGDGVRDKGGKPFRFTLAINAGNSRRADVAQIVQQQLKQIGVDMQIQALESNTFFDRLRRKNFEAALAGWSVGLSPADLTNFWGPNVPFNFVSYENPEVTRLFEQALAEPTAARANSYWKTAAERIVADQPITWLYYYDTVNAVSNRLRGMKIDTYGSFQNAWEWWIPREMQRGTSTAPASDTTP